MKKYIFIILAILIASPFIYSEFFGYKAPKQSEAELEAWKEKIRIEGGERIIKNYTKFKNEYLDQHKKDPKAITPLAGLTETYWMLSRGYNQLHEYEKAKEPYAESLKYLAKYEQAMEDAWSQRHKKISDSNILHIIKFYIHLNPAEEKEKYWKQKWLDLNLEKWERGEQTYQVAYWIRGMYSGKTEFDPKTGRQATMPQILHWTNIMNEIGKPDDWHPSQPW